MSRDLLSIVIVNFNGAKFLPDCIQSIQVNCANIAYEIIIVDNNSTDESNDLIKKHFPEVKLVENHENYGFARGNNIGVNQSQGEYILLLNNDTLLADNLKPAIDLLKSDETIGAVGIKMVDGDKSYRQSAGYFPSPLRLLKLKSMLIHKDGFSDGYFEKSQRFFPVDWVEASFLLTKHSIWDTLEGMDETFFMYAEDLDFCKRLNGLRKKTVYLHELCYTHFGGFNTKRNELLKKGLILYVNKHFTGTGKWIGRLNIEINFFIKKHVKKSV